MTEIERLFEVISRTQKMIKSRQQEHETAAKSGSGPSSKSRNGLRAKECGAILEEMYKIVLECENL